jgi:hypothetical protein
MKRRCHRTCPLWRTRVDLQVPMNLTSTAFTSTGSASLTPLRARAPPPCSPSLTGRRTRTARLGRIPCMHRAFRLLRPCPEGNQTTRRGGCVVPRKNELSRALRTCGDAEPRSAGCRRGEASRAAAARDGGMPGRPRAGPGAGGSASRRAPREKIMRPASLVRTDGRIRQPQGRCVRASPAQMPASTRRREFFLATSPSDPPLSSLDLFSRSVKKNSPDTERIQQQHFSSASLRTFSLAGTRVQPATDHVSVSHTPTPPSLSNF